MHKPLIAMAVFAGLTAAAPAAAQDAKLLPNRDTAESMQSYANLLKHSDCLLVAGQTAEGILTDEPNSKSERTKTALLRQRVKTCDSKGLENIHSLVRGSLAEAMYLRQVPRAPAVDAARAQAFLNAEKAFHSSREKNDQVVANVVSCMVAASPTHAHAVLTAQHGTAAEDAAMNALFAAGQKCGAGSARPANLSRSFLRAFVADSAWRLARAAR